LRKNRIIEVAGILAIDRDERQAPQVFPALRLARIDPVAPGLRLAQRFGGEAVGKIEARDGGFRGELHRTVGVESLFDPGVRRRRSTAMSGYARDDPFAVARTVERVVCDRASKLQASIRSANPCSPAQNLDSPKERIDAVLDNLLDGAQPTIARVPRQANAQSIAVHDPPHLGRWQKDAVLHSFDPQEAIACAVGAHLSLDHTAGMGAGGGAALTSRLSRCTDLATTLHRLIRRSLAPGGSHPRLADAVSVATSAPVTCAFVLQRGPRLGMGAGLAVTTP